MQAYVGQAEQLGIRDRIKFLGYCRDILPILAAADVVVVPSTCTDGFPSAVLEAMAAGRPVVASRIGGIPEAVDDGTTGFLVEPGIAVDLASKMAWLMDAADLRFRMGTNALQHLKTHFSPAQCVQAMDEVYRDVLHESDALATSRPS
jgi:glycosyltransferase involved in cell wall biosynthesis